MGNKSMTLDRFTALHGRVHIPDGNDKTPINRTIELASGKFVSLLNLSIARKHPAWSVYKAAGVSKERPAIVWGN